MLAVRSLLGFGAGALAPLSAGFTYDAATAMQLPPAAVWGLTFATLGLGGLCAALCAAGLGRARTSRG